MDIDIKYELEKCANDFYYFCENYVKIIDINRNLVDFKLYDYQKRYINEIENNRFLINKKFRMGGFTTTNLVWSLWNCMFKYDQNIIFLSKQDRDCINNSDLLRDVIINLPDWLKPHMNKLSDYSFVFNKSENKIHFNVPEMCCGKHSNYVFIEEAAFIKNMDQHWKAIFPLIASKRGRCIISSSIDDSSVNSTNWFKKTYQDAEQNKIWFSIFHCSYLENPIFATYEWQSKMKNILGEKYWKSAVLCEFEDKDLNCVLYKDKVIYNGMIYDF